MDSDAIVSTLDGELGLFAQFHARPVREGGSFH
jgi:hypothetical protein